ncbi:MAG: phospholipid-binding protein MlaC [Rhizomicrobium sp.]
MSRFNSAALFLRLKVALSACMIAIATVVAAPALAQTPAEAYVQQNVQKGLTILNDHSIPDAQRRAEFREFLTSLTDIRRIALFTLGAARRTASPADIEAFVDAFRDYAVAVYESRLNQYSGQYLRVTGSTEIKPGDDIVETVLVDPSGKSNGQDPIKVDFRVDQENGRSVVVDVSIVGVWLGLEERDQFAAFLQQHNNDISALVTHLQDLTAKLRNGAAQDQTH